MKNIELRDLPEYSSWPKIILGIENPKKNLSKTKDKIRVEYDIDKWGSLLSHIRSLRNPTIYDADQFFLNNCQDVAFYYDGSLFAAKQLEIQSIYHQIISNELTKYSSHQLIELGAGYGHVVLNISHRPDFKSTDFLACEFTNSGISCMDILTGNHGCKTVKTGYCDLEDLCLDHLDVQKSPVFFTAYTMPCIKGFPSRILHELKKVKAYRVIHFEPIYDHWNDDNLLHLMWMSYAKTNDYNLTMLKDLRALEALGDIAILREEKNIFGSHALFPISIVEWAPV